MTDNLIFNRNIWVAVTPSALSDSMYVEYVPDTLYVLQSQHDQVVKALQDNSDFLRCVADALRDGQGRESPFLDGADAVGVWAMDTIPASHKQGNTHVGRVGDKTVVLFTDVDHEHGIGDYFDTVPEGFVIK